MSTPRTVSELIQLFGTAEKFGAAIGLKTYSHGRIMKMRNSVPRRHWDNVVLAASRLGIEGINHRVLERIHEASSRPTPQPEEGRAA
ncbi:hypothetical protein [Enterovirga sp. CN4-39]|uniref:hypothetical protein n=1 Tax=Enterovirga sp. CN4-39 TaxID=3400910 RepID=UPI003C0B5829